MRRLFVLLALVLVALTDPAAAQPAAADATVAAADATVAAAVQPAATDASMYYVVAHRVTVYTEPETGRAYLQMGFREPLFVEEQRGGWSRIRTQDGARGWVTSDAISNVWVRVSKRQRALYLYRGTNMVMKVPADFGYNAYADKERRGSVSNPDHWRTPEGVFFVVKKNPHSKFYKALVLNYPTAEDAERGLRQGIISSDQHRAIVEAENSFSMPPMSTALGGMIEIHGDGTGASTNWTQGCVAVHNDHIEQLWEWVTVGTPVLVER